MLRIVDGRTGELVDVDPGRRAPLRVLAHPPGAGGLTAVRVLLVADVLARTAEMYSGQVLVGTVGPPDEALDRAAAAMGIKPAAASGGTAAEVEEALAGRARAHVVAGPAEVSEDGIRMEAGPVSPYDVPAGPVLRLALLGADRRAPLELTARALDEAAATLNRWRRAVAVWAEAPSKPMCAAYVEGMQAALTGDLDTAAVLDALGSLERETALPDGSRFETFAHADRVLALELSREVGGVRS